MQISSVLLSTRTPDNGLNIVDVLKSVCVKNLHGCQPGAKGQADWIPDLPMESQITKGYLGHLQGHPLFPLLFGISFPMLRTFAKRRFARVISSIRRTTLKCRCFVQPPISMPSPPILWTFANRNTCPVFIFVAQSIRRIQMCI